jgi:hypothetical protein
MTENIYQTTRRHTVEDKNLHVGSDLVTVLVRKSSIFWDVRSCSPPEINMLSRWFLARLILLP